MNTAQTPAARKSAAVQQATLDALVAVAAEKAAAGMSDMAGRMAAVLLDMTTAGLEPQAAARRIRSGNLLRDNAYAFVHLASTGIELALAGIEFKIPVDEVIDVMGEIGASMDVRYRETAGGGLAATPTGRRLARERLVQIKRR